MQQVTDLLAEVVAHLKAIRESATQRPAPELLAIAEVASLLSIGRATIERNLAAGKFLEPVWIGGVRRWRRAEVSDWVAAGCPDRKVWEAMRRSK